MEQFPTNMTPVLISSGNTEYQIEGLVLQKLWEIKPRLQFYKLNEPSGFGIKGLNIPAANDLARKIRKLDEFNKRAEELGHAQKLIKILVNDDGNPYRMIIWFRNENKNHMENCIWARLLDLRIVIFNAFKEKNCVPLTVNLFRELPVVVDRCVKELEDLGWSVKRAERWPEIDDDFSEAVLTLS